MDKTLPDAAAVRRQLVEALEYNLIGPWPEHPLQEEEIYMAPSRWYLTGFLLAQGVPAEGTLEGAEEADLEDEEEMAAEGRPGTDDNPGTEGKQGGKARLPSTVGLSLLVRKETRQLNVEVTWGEYELYEREVAGQMRQAFRRLACREPMSIDLDKVRASGTLVSFPLPGRNGLKVAARALPVRLPAGVESPLPEGCISLAVFLVNDKPNLGKGLLRELNAVFQVRMRLTADAPIVARPNLQSVRAPDWDQRLADLQYRDACEYAVGHGVSARAVMDAEGRCHTVETRWFPEAEVERVKPGSLRKQVELHIKALAALEDGSAASKALMPLVEDYREWLEDPAYLKGLTGSRLETAQELKHRALLAAKRIEAGIACLEQPENLLAFKWANEAMAMAAEKRLGLTDIKWHPFQLAFILMNLPGMVDPAHDDRAVVDLLFFPTGGGKTEAYLGLAAFNLFQRRLRHGGKVDGAGVSVIMRYTLRLLTLDQLGRASGLICAMELIRRKNAEKLGTWPFEIGLWVGTGATPNVMGERGESNPYSVRAKLRAWKQDRIRNAPIPLENCPWCNTAFEYDSFQLVPDVDFPKNLVVRCLNPSCDFSAARNQALPLVAIDEPLYRRLPCFIIATVDKFASLPWEGRTGALFGRVQRYDKEGFYGPCDPGLGASLLTKPLDPPDLIIQDELHLISGPLGTVAGLYETALEEMCRRKENGKVRLPKIIASTATVRRASAQIQALFGRPDTVIFPPPSPDRRNSFFAKVVKPEETPARLYLGLAAQGRNPKEILLRACLTLMSRVEALSLASGGRKKDSPADPYMTLIGYFNSIRELGGARRLFEGEIFAKLRRYADRKRLNEDPSLFVNREAKAEVPELTSRLPTSKVSETKRALEQPVLKGKGVDIALATNMISVGLDIDRLGLMLVYGQPKSTSEYIQATSRVGRKETKPGLVVTVYNVHKPRDRSYYERFAFFHQTFYRGVEAASVTPFSTRALDRALLPVVVALARHFDPALVAGSGAGRIVEKREALSAIVELLGERAKGHRTQWSDKERSQLVATVEGRVKRVLDDWRDLAQDFEEAGSSLKYQRKDSGGKALLSAPLDDDLETLTPKHRKFVAPRSLRDVEPSVQLLVTNLDGTDAPPEET